MMKSFKYNGRNTNTNTSMISNGSGIGQPQKKSTIIPPVNKYSNGYYWFKKSI